MINSFENKHTNIITQNMANIFEDSILCTTRERMDVLQLISDKYHFSWWIVRSFFPNENELKSSSVSEIS